MIAANAVRWLRKVYGRFTTRIAKVASPSQVQAAAPPAASTPPSKSRSGTIFWHVGRTKTGTGAVQRFLSANRPALEDAGFVYPPGDRLAHHELARQLRALSDPRSAGKAIASAESYINHFAASLPEDRHVIISSEALQDVDPGLLARFFPIERSVVVMYLREQLDFLWSHYCQRVHATTTFTEPFSRVSRAVRPDYKYVADRWASVFPPDRLLVRVYHRSCLDNGDIIDDFLSVTGLQRTAAFVDPGMEYVSIGTPLVEFKRRLNLVLGQGGADERTSAILFNSLRRLATKDPEMSAKPRLDAKFCAAYRSRFIKSNAALFATYVRSPPSAFPMTDFTRNCPREFSDNELIARIQTVSPQLGPMLRDLLARPAERHSR